MSRAWIAFYPGDYDKDTQHLSTLEHGAYFLLLKHCWIHGQIPLEQEKRANIARLTMREWKKVTDTVSAFFEDDGSQCRATREIEKAEIVRTKRAIAGQRGGFASGISKAVRQGQESKRVANAKRTTKQNSQPSEATLNSSKLSTTVDEDTGPSNGKYSVSTEALAKIGGPA